MKCKKYKINALTNKHKIAVGVGLVALGLIIYNEVQKRNDNPKIYYRKKLYKNFNARTIPPFGIYLQEDQKNNKALIEHELVHWKQYQRMGLINFYSQYFKELKSLGYDLMPMEIEARKNESEFCKTNYTFCVRTGIANTVQNNNFLV